MYLHVQTAVKKMCKRSEKTHLFLVWTEWMWEWPGRVTWCAQRPQPVCAATHRARTPASRAPLPPHCTQHPETSASLSPFLRVNSQLRFLRVRLNYSIDNVSQVSFLLSFTKLIFRSETHIYINLRTLSVFKWHLRW